MTILRRIIFVVILLIPTQLFAARPADIIEKTFVLYGKDADEAAKLLGMNSERTTLKLSWDSKASKRGCSWGDVGSGNVPRCEDLPTLVNTIYYSPGKKSELKLSGHWLDNLTASGAHFKTFSFWSQGYNTTQEVDSDWRYVAQGEISEIPLKLENSFKQSKIVIGGKPPFFQVNKVENYAGKIMLGITMDFDSAEEHVQKVIENKRQIKKYGHLDGGW